MTVETEYTVGDVVKFQDPATQIIRAGIITKLSISEGDQVQYCINYDHSDIKESEITGKYDEVVN